MLISVVRFLISRNSFTALIVCVCPFRNHDLVSQLFSEADAAQWAWATNMFNECSAKDEEVAKIKAAGFLGKFIAAALSPESLKALKKETGEDYHAELLRSTDAIKAPIEAWSAIVARIRAMAEGGGIIEANGPAKKRPRKTK